MSDNIEKLGNEPTNPTYFKDGEIDGCGLTKREYFAGLAMQAIISKIHNQATFERVANDAIEYADELLKALENEN